MSSSASKRIADPRLPIRVGDEVVASVKPHGVSPATVIDVKGRDVLVEFTSGSLYLQRITVPLTHLDRMPAELYARFNGWMPPAKGRSGDDVQLNVLKE